MQDSNAAQERERYYDFVLVLRKREQDSPQMIESFEEAKKSKKRRNLFQALKRAQINAQRFIPKKGDSRLEYYGLWYDLCVPLWLFICLGAISQFLRR